MGKNRNREALIRTIINTIVHEILAEHTNKPESGHFLKSEVIEYRSQAKKKTEKHNWNNEDIAYIKENALKRIKERLDNKYSDIEYSETEAKEKLENFLNKIKEK